MADRTDWAEFEFTCAQGLNIDAESGIRGCTISRDSAIRDGSAARGAEPLSDHGTTACV